MPYPPIFTATDALSRFEVRWPAWLIGAAAWALLFLSDGVLSLGNLALLLVLASAISSLWLSALASIVVSALSVALFNWFFVAPRYTFHVQLHQDLLLLTTMLGVSAVVSYLMARLRAAVAAEQRHAHASEELRLWGERLRASSMATEQAQLLRDLVESQSLSACALVHCPAGADKNMTNPETIWLGETDEIQRQGLLACMHEGLAFGAGTGRHVNHMHVFLPIRGRTRIFGALVVHELGRKPYYVQALRDYLQQAADMLGLEWERAHTLAQAQKAQQLAQHQSLRNTLLTSISHDYRTPLASLMSAASLLHDQAPRLGVEKIQSLSQTVLDEAQHLNRMTNNTLQLARLDSSPLTIGKDWESVHEFLGSVISKMRQRFSHRTLRVSLPQQLPLLYCDALLLIQLFENLIENAIAYSPSDTVVEVQANMVQQEIQIRVVDQGFGIADEWKVRVFQAFERVQTNSSRADATEPQRLRRGVGVGLAVCQAIAKVHDASITVHDNLPQGTIMCVHFPVVSQPEIQAFGNEVTS